MESFSQRKGIKPVRTEIQRESMDDDLRMGLWNTLYKCYFGYLPFSNDGDYYYYIDLSEHLDRDIWGSYFKRSLDEMKDSQTYSYIKIYFFECKWHEVYDLIEFIHKTYLNQIINENFKEECNKILELNLSAYRFVGDKIVEITSEEEIAEIVSASQIPIVKEHINCSLELFSNRTNPDYRNSIKESISAVESLCKLITGNDKATLGDALKVIEAKLNIGLHPALKDAFSKLYGYTSNANGIRHGLTDEPNLYSEDARFMLIACSAFIIYLSAKASKAGINLQ